ncbi:sensor domain-containing protein [Actinoplanes derwentensis]|uniref:PknH-like extracellular domain-containing protein n=1 Tax=Actinoplanes derwentensis TaxID=113562 RepID=A0A1H1WX97_9ACTN|nr:sensor domain-containing protein [Actinoplanes derwentensis]GID90496.1 hypothetical protein Ade03nite_94200 [Actinoplanes derwentensis]SDT01735.1 PknH-like extracellular domain-containing protein [Actinoplanes derwentensis]
MRLGILVLTMALLTGCGSGSDDRGTTLQPPAPTAESIVDRVFGDDQVQNALLTVADLPTGWSVKPRESRAPRDDSDEYAECSEFAAALIEYDDLSHGGVDFTAPSGATVNQGVLSVTEPKARSFLADFATAVTKCPKMTGTTRGGHSITMYLTALSFPKLADETFALRMSTTASTQTITMDLVMVRRAGVITGVVQTTIGTVDTTTTEDIARRALAKVEKTLI